ncbi:hypothetical protein GE107_07475 [Cohnella sp. CFH 77786]|uniref:S-layer homology domain-containing protein n=1 Tax=Cohnella sp. CFH 77786 TaxID=2662265 RepID=UPI001C60BA6B|nr:S-layer homology domain-containing protein [Cohnella sp. CFH 77786]MBW5445897.1 hypothetical protein [Cohnella sp. CFH 77786]
MRESSYQSSTQHQQMFSQGGEKKVMKKSLSVLLSAALAFGAFASVASAADPATAQEKFDALKAKGIFAGMADGSAGLNQNMTRAQFARVLGLLKGINVDAEPTVQTFTDVAKTAWYYQEVEAAVAANLLVGVGGGKFNPNGDVTVQELAVAAAKALGLAPVADAKVEGAADWAAGYIKALIDNGINLPTTYTAAATREILVNASYEVYVKTQAPAKVSVASAKATGVSKVTVTLDKAVDTAKAVLTLKRGTATVATTSAWSDDKKTATLTLTDTKITEADYTVTLSGLAAEEIATATASFKGEKETVSKLEFVSATDEIATTTNARIRLKAENQYGEFASFGSANFTVNASADFSPSLTKDSDGYLVIKLNTKAAVDANKATSGLTQIPVYVYFNDTHLTANKVFKLGFAPFVSKMELGEMKYDNGKTALINVGETATADVKLFDQYGNPVTVSQNVLQQVNGKYFNTNIVPYSQYAVVTDGDFDNDDEFEVRVSLSKKEDKASTHTLTVYAGSGVATTKFDVGTSKVATQLDLEFNGTLAQGDSGKLVTLNAYDANGDKLTPQEIVDNKDRITVTASGVASAQLITVGPDKGKIRLGATTVNAKSYVFVTASILSPNVNTLKTMQIVVADPRVPASLTVAKKPAAKAVLNATSGFDFQVKDQYGDNIGGNTPSTDYRVQYDYVPNASGITVSGGTLSLSVASTVYEYTLDNVNADNKQFNAQTGIFGTSSLKATLQQKVGSDWRDIATPVTVSIEAINPALVQLNYSISDITSLYASLDNASLFPAAPYSILGGKTQKEITLTVKDNAGNTVAYPANIKDVTTSNNLVAQVTTGSNTAFVTGNKAGEATVTAVVYKANGETATLSAKVTVKNDAVVADSLSSDSSEDLGTGSALVDAGALMTAKVKDNYGIEYDATDIQTFQKLLGIRYTVSDITNAQVTINPTSGVITAFTQVDGTKPYQFVVTATAPNGKSTSTVFFGE